MEHVVNFFNNLSIAEWSITAVITATWLWDHGNKFSTRRQLRMLNKRIQDMESLVKTYMKDQSDLGRDFDRLKATLKEKSQPE